MLIWHLNLTTIFALLYICKDSALFFFSEVWWLLGTAAFNQLAIIHQHKFLNIWIRLCRPPRAFQCFNVHVSWFLCGLIFAHKWFAEKFVLLTSLWWIILIWEWWLNFLTNWLSPWLWLLIFTVVLGVYSKLNQMWLQLICWYSVANYSNGSPAMWEHSWSHSLWLSCLV